MTYLVFWEDYVEPRFCRRILGRSIDQPHHPCKLPFLDGRRWIDARWSRVDGMVHGSLNQCQSDSPRLSMCRTPMRVDKSVRKQFAVIYSQAESERSSQCSS